MSTTITVAGIDASQIAPHSQPTYEDHADGGCGVARWEWQLPKVHGGAATTRGAKVVISAWGHPVYFGELDTIADGEVTCRGKWAAGETIAALDGSGMATRDVGTALAANMARWGITNRAGVSGVVSGDDGDPQMMTDLLGQYASQSGRYIGVDAAGDLYYRQDSTIPRWYIHAGDVDLGGSDALSYSRLIGRHRDMTGTLQTAYSSGSVAPHVDGLVDLVGPDANGRKWGRMTGVDATAILTNLLTKVGLKPTWTTTLDLHASQVTTRGGVPANLDAIRACDRARIHSLTASQQAAFGAPYIDVTLGTVTRTTGTPMIQIGPTGSTPQTLEAALGQVGR